MLYKFEFKSFPVNGLKSKGFSSDNLIYVELLFFIVSSGQDVGFKYNEVLFSSQIINKIAESIKNSVNYITLSTEEVKYIQSRVTKFNYSVALPEMAEFIKYCFALPEFKEDV